MADDDPRVPLAAERTLLAWVRTGLGVIGTGFLVARFGHSAEKGAGVIAPPAMGPIWIGVALVLAGAGSIAGAGWLHARFSRRLASGGQAASGIYPWRAAVAFAIVIAVAGVGLAASIVILSGAIQPQGRSPAAAPAAGTNGVQSR